MNAPRAILFDLDNTAYAYAPCHRAGLAAAGALAARLHAPWCEGERFADAYERARHHVKAQVGTQAAAHCRLLYFKTMVDDFRGRSDLDTTQQLHDAYWHGYAASMRVEPGCRDCFAELRAAGVRTAWVTNFTTLRQFQKLHDLGLSDAADYLFTSEEAGADKPDVRLAALALNRLGVPASAAWLVGDSLADDGGLAEASGCRFVWYRRDPRYQPEPAPVTVDSWDALRGLLHAALANG